MGDDQHISILIIEDNPGDQLLLHENLISTNLLIGEVIMVETLSEGMVELASGSFSLIFLDLFLTDSGGLDSFSELIKIDSKTPVVIYSGLSDTQVALKAINLGAQDFLIKGDYTIGLLEKTIRYSIERKKNLDALEKSNEKYNLVSKATHDMVWDSDLITGEVHRNPEGWKKIFRTEGTAEAGTFKDFNSRVHPDDYTGTMKSFYEIIHSDDQEVFDLEFRIIRDDGTVGWLEDRGYIIRDNKGKAVRLTGATHDITERKNAEQKALWREQRFRSLVQNGVDLIGVIDKEGNYTHAGGSRKKVMGYGSDAFLGTTPFSFIHPGDAEIIKTALSDIQNKSYLQLPPYRYRYADGTWRWMQTTLSNLLEDPAVQGIIANSRDITESKIAADEIEKLSLVAQHTLSGVYITGADRKIQWVNEAFTRITGFTLEDVIGKKPPDILSRDSTDETYINARLAAGLSFEGEKLNYAKSGNPIWIWLQLQPIYGATGEIKQYFGIQTDITEKKQVEEELKKLSMVAKETINGVIISDIDQNVIWVNAAFTRMYEYELNDVLGKNPVNYLPGNETDTETLAYINEQLKADQPFVFEIINYTKRRNPIEVRVQVQPIFDEEGNVKQFFSLHTDITKEKELERDIEDAKIIKNKQITNAVFAAQESERSEIGREMHDNVNQLLGAVRLYIDMARGNEKNRESLLTSASTFTLNAIEEIRKLSKTLITPLINEIGLVDSIKDLTAEIMLVHPIDILLTSAGFHEDGLTDKFKLNIFRIVQEQLTNTLKHAKAKTIAIIIKEWDGKLSISITDDGIGFNTATRKAGVGITNIKSRSELYNGMVKLSSEHGKGTALSVTFNKEDLVNKNNQFDS